MEVLCKSSDRERCLRAGWKKTEEPHRELSYPSRDLISSENQVLLSHPNKLADHGKQPDITQPHSNKTRDLPPIGRMLTSHLPFLDRHMSKNWEWGHQRACSV